MQQCVEHTRGVDESGLGGRGLEGVEIEIDSAYWTLEALCKVVEDTGVAERDVFYTRIVPLNEAEGIHKSHTSSMDFNRPSKILQQ